MDRRQEQHSIERERAIREEIRNGGAIYKTDRTKEIGFLCVGWVPDLVRRLANQ